MTKTTTKIHVQMYDGTDIRMAARLSIMYGQDLIILNAGFISAQWPLNGTGVRLHLEGETLLKIGFYHTQCASSSYQSFYFDAAHYDELEKFFKDAGFPIPDERRLDS